MFKLASALQHIISMRFFYNQHWQWTTSRHVSTSFTSSETTFTVIPIKLQDNSLKYTIKTEHVQLTAFGIHPKIKIHPHVVPNVYNWLFFCEAQSLFCCFVVVNAIKVNGHHCCLDFKVKYIFLSCFNLSTKKRCFEKCLSGFFMQWKSMGSNVAWILVFFNMCFVFF